jgi:hypothetical protein
MNDLETALDKLDDWIDEMESAEVCIWTLLRADADGVDADITGVLYDHGGCDLDDVANIEVDASSLREAFDWGQRTGR